VRSFGFRILNTLQAFVFFVVEGAGGRLCRPRRTEENQHRIPNMQTLPAFALAADAPASASGNGKDEFHFPGGDGTGSPPATGGQAQPSGHAEHAVAAAHYKKNVEADLARTPPTLDSLDPQTAKDQVVCGGSAQHYEQYVTNLALQPLAPFLSPARALAAAGAALVRNLDSRLVALAVLIAGTTQYQDEVTENKPWTVMDILAAVLLAVVSFALLASDLNTVATVLVASGVPGMTDKVLALLWSLLPVGIAVDVKFLERAVKLDEHKRLYVASTWIVGGGLALVWALLFPRCFDAHLGQSATDLLAAAANPAEAASPSKGYWLITLGMVASGLLAGGCWLTWEAIAASHRVSRRYVNPLFKKLSEDQATLRKARDEVDLARSRIEGRVQSLEAAIAAYVTEGNNQFGLAQKSLALQMEATQAFAERAKKPYLHRVGVKPTQ